MAQLVVRNIEDDLKIRLQRRAARHGRSMEAEVREILREALRQEDPQRGGLGSEIAAMFAGIGLEDGEIEEMRGFVAEPVDFGQ